MSLVEDFAPRSFDDLVGQPTAQKLFKKWSKDLNKMPKVTFLVGNTGRGKTTSIKLLSAMVTCKSPVSENVPCGTCASCKNALDEQWNPMYNVHFFSGRAANVDLIDLVAEKLEYNPMGSDYRVVIFDELQDASKGFLKALLSLLEKKKTRTKFIISTMDEKALVMKGPNPKALVSRGTLVKFNRPKDEVLTNRLFEIADLIDPQPEDGQTLTEEDIKYKIEGLSIPDSFFEKVVPSIVVEADGSVRQAVQLFDTCIQAEAWTEEEASPLLSSASSKEADEALQAILDKSPEVFSVFKKIESIETLYRLANSKITNSVKKFIEGSLDNGDFYSNKCKEVYTHKNFGAVREMFKKVHTSMPSYWRDDIFESMVCDYILDSAQALAVTTKPVTERPKRGPRGPR